MSKVRFFEIREKPKPNKGSVITRRHWCLPGVACDKCGETWATTGLEFPTVDLSVLDESKEMVEPRVVTFQEYSRLVIAIRNCFPDQAILRPGTGFGKLYGSASGRLSDFTIVNVTDILVTSSTLEELTGVVNVPHYVRADLVIPDSSEILFEFELQPEGLMANRVERSDLCSQCGRVDITLPEKIILDSESLPIDLDLFRLKNFPTILVASERFVEVYKRRGLQGLRFDSLEIC